MLQTKALTLPFNRISRRDVPIVGGKNANLGEMYRQLTRKGVNVPNGFAVTAQAYDYFITTAGIKKRIRDILKGLNTHNLPDLIRRGALVRKTILEAEFPANLKRSIVKAYRELCRSERRTNLDVAVRSSATAEDLPDASFAGQQETFLNIRGDQALLDACKRCFASLFTNRAISYRHDKHFDHFKVKLSIGVQTMVRSDLACSGVMFSIDTDSGFPHVVLINGSWGLGENIVQGAVTPDEFIIHKPTLKLGFRPIVKKQLGDKQIKMIYAAGSKPTRNVAVSAEDQQRFVISDAEALKLARWTMRIEDHYRKPMDMEWAKDGRNGKLYVVQARPETVHAVRDYTQLEQYELTRRAPVLASGMAIGTKIGSGRANVIRDAKHITKFKKGDVLVTEKTDPDWEPIMKIASAIVTDKGGRTSHAAIVSRELGIPAIVGTGNASKAVKTGVPVTVSCADGEVGKVYRGLLPFRVRRHDLRKLKRPKTKIMMNIGEPDQAFRFAMIPNDGVGLAREEFIINSAIGIHPMALLRYPRLKDRKAVREIARRTVGYRNKADFFVDKLAMGVGQIAAAFYPRDVILRFSDFKTNEYANLLGGREFEPVESNPMIGWRGASRYYDPMYEPAFALECKAIKKVREEMGLKNLKVMVPFCRTVEEGKKVVATMRKYGLRQSLDGLEVYVMCEIPSNVVLAEEFAKVFDGFSIGSNDLSQLTLGLDRDSEIVNKIGDERNEAVKRMLLNVIKTAKRARVKIGICGQAPSDFPEIARLIAKAGIDSMSLNPDTVLKTTIDILKLEKKR